MGFLTSKNCLILIFFLLFSESVKAQEKFWLDVKPNENSFEQNQLLIKNAGFNILYYSKWLNSFAVQCNNCSFRDLNASISVKIEKQNGYFFSAKTTSYNSKNLALALRQIKADTLDALGLNGKGIKIGIVDGGFMEANSKNTLKNVFNNKNVKFILDLVTPNQNDSTFYVSKNARDDHGTEVWEYIAGEEENFKYGLATDAEFYLIRTENGKSEQIIEEYNWIKAIELLHEKGVKLVNTSLGYSKGFSNEAENHFVKEMNGETTHISKFTEIAANEMGMILLVAAGNEGNNTEWQVVTAPGDSKHVISIGAVDTRGTKMGYSSIGPSFTEFIKPDLSVYSYNGTSLSTPIIAGLVACMLQKDSTLTTSKIRELLIKSSNLYPFPNNFIGYGVPNVLILLKLMDGIENLKPVRKIFATDSDTFIHEFEIDDFPESYLYFHKMDEKIVVKQHFKKNYSNLISIQREKRANFTTVDFGKHGIFEIKWGN